MLELDSKNNYVYRRIHKLFGLFDNLILNNCTSRWWYFFLYIIHFFILWCKYFLVTASGCFTESVRMMEGSFTLTQTQVLWFNENLRVKIDWIQLYSSENGRGYFSQKTWVHMFKKPLKAQPELFYSPLIYKNVIKRPEWGVCVFLQVWSSTGLCHGSSAFCSNIVVDFHCVVLVFIGSSMMF